ncbi:IMPACT family protein [Thalassospira povalilytica]|uniref:YigZ family protein n=1 Tax=Thalassospira povalilytica TaxID=732237 RepID=A0A8I1SKU5_9PROT|nr:YigZ family protein [Thalassospira povalilytica]MBN8198055.1 YigZ family protein [Thalassospira povalilytica]
MKTIARPAFAETEEKKSRFLAELVFHDDLARRIDALRALHPKANHHVNAYRYLNEEDQLIEHGKDDGEPSGTSGIPCLKVLQGRDLINVAVIVTRYFGGTKLGTGGLVRAYSGAANAVCDVAEIIDYIPQGEADLFAGFSDAGTLEQACAQDGITILDRQFDTQGTRIKITGPREMLGDLAERFPLPDAD